MGVLPTGGRGKPPHPGPAALGAASSRAPRGVVVVVVVVGLVGGAEGHPYVKRTNPSMIKRQKTLSLASALTSRFTFMYDFKCLTHTNTCTVCFVCVCVCVCVCVQSTCTSHVRTNALLRLDGGGWGRKSAAWRIMSREHRLSSSVAVAWRGNERQERSWSLFPTLHSSSRLMGSTNSPPCSQRSATVFECATVLFQCFHSTQWG